MQVERLFTIESFGDGFSLSHCFDTFSSCVINSSSSYRANEANTVVVDSRLNVRVRVRGLVATYDIRVPYGGLQVLRISDQPTVVAIGAGQGVDPSPRINPLLRSAQIEVEPYHSV